MKMTQLLRRIVSVWLCVAVVCWHPSCYVGCTEPKQEAQRPASSQDSSPEEETGEKPHQQKIEEHLVVPAQSPESEQLVEDDHHKEEKITPEVDKRQHVETSETQESASKAELEADKEISQSEQRSEYQHPETSNTQNQDPVPLLPSSDIASGFSAENKEDSSIPNLQDNIPSSASGDVSDVALPEVIDSDLPPADCEEEEDNPFDSENPPLVLENTSNAHMAGTKSHTDPPLSPPAGHSAQHTETNTSHMMKEQDLSSPVSTDTDSSGSSKDPEDIPTFDEWKRKMMEVENEKTLSTHTSHNGGSHTAKKVQKNFNNYASVECGAKILGANPEAKSTSAILKENMDLYMLNPCSNKIWFIIELCEPIQLKQLDIANFELFSSTPKDFLVSISDRYPTNKWLKLGTFHARDERTVQSFPLDEHLYAKYVKMFTKYIKVELVSHFGSEHFCPLSLIRVFGTSMVEEYEEIAEPSERTDDPDDDLDYHSGFASGEAKLSNNLIGSAKDAILNMVNNIAVNVLGGGPEMQGNLSSLEVNMTEPSQQDDTSAQETSTDLIVEPDTEDEKLTPHDETLEIIPPTPKLPLTETPTTPDESTEQLPPLEEKIVIPLEKDEEEPVSPTVTLLDKEEELDEEEERVDYHEQQQEILNYCAVGSSLSSSCSCAASVYEYLLKQCSVCLSKKRKCQTTERKPVIEPIQTPSWQPPVSPSVCPEPPKRHSEVQEPREKEQAPEQEPESVAITSEAPQHPGNASESAFEAPLLEPSQTVNLPKPSAADSSSARSTPIVETPQLSSERPVEAPESQDVPLNEEQIEPSASISTSVDVKPPISATVDESPTAVMEEKPTIDASQVEASIASSPTQEKTDQSTTLLPTISPQIEQQPELPVSPESGASSTEVSPDAIADPEPSGSQAAITDPKPEDLAEDVSASSGGSSQLPQPSSTLPPPPTSPSLSDIYAEPPNGTEQNGNPVHGSSQKESVFMRLNNRIKALEMNMSLSGRYLEQLSQRYRKQMEEMQKAFNKTIIKLQNTSRIAEEQDQRQTESIQLLQGQLENVTQLVLNLSVRVSQLQTEVSERQNYLLLSLVVCLSVGLLLCVNYCRISTTSPTTEPEPPIPKSYTYCCPERQLSSCDETGLKRSASYPLIHSESLQLAATEGKDPELLHAEETQSLGPGNRKRRRRKIKPLEKVETLKPSLHPAPELCNGAVFCNGVPVITNPAPFTKRFLHPAFRDSPSEGSSEASSHSDDPSFCGIATACPRICDGLPPPKTRAERRALRRRRPKPSCAVVDFLHAPRREKTELLPVSTIEDIMKRKTEPSSGTIVTFSGPV